MTWRVWLPLELAHLSLLMMWLLTAATWWNLKCAETSYLLRFIQIIKKSFTALNCAAGQMTQYPVLKQPNRILKNRMFLTGQVNHLTPIQLNMHFTCGRKDWGLKPPETKRNWGWLQYIPGRASPGSIARAWLCLWATYVRQSSNAKDLQSHTKYAFFKDYANLSNSF